MKPTVFVHTNDRQMVGAVVSAHSLRRNAKDPESFDVRIIRQEDYPFFRAREGQSFLRAGGTRVWRNDDLQSFTPLRFMPPELMGYEGRAVVIDPDVFAVGDISELLARDMQGKAMMCRARPGHNRRAEYLASSVMLLDCAKLSHWSCEEQFGEMFAMQRDYELWISLESEPRGNIGLFEEEWNHFDRLEPGTKLIHNTKRRTQPWKTGLPVDFTIRDRMIGGVLPTRWIYTADALLRGEPAGGLYRRHPDPRQEAFFYGLVRECLDEGLLTEDFLREEMRRGHIRRDSLDLVERARGGAIAA